MKIFKTIVLITFISLIACNTKTATEKIQVQGHRGDRGNFPENTIEGFLSALHKGVDVIELDVVISKDRQVVVSHEPYMSSLYMSSPSGEPIQEAYETELNLYQMTYDSIKQFDSGLRGNRNFPEQKKMKTYKPLLSEVFEIIEKGIADKNLPSVKYNIEIKSIENQYGISQPQPEDFVSLVMKVINTHNMRNKINIQSFDPTILNVVHKKHPEIEMAYLVSKGSIQENLKLLTFKPAIYSPNFRLIESTKMVDSIKILKMKLIPWTVNDYDDIKKILAFNVDGIITDYPERVLKLIE